MNIDKLYLEITRDCTLNCEHCLKGEKEHVNMSINTIKNIFNDISKVNTLLLTGGEPLLNIKVIEEITKLIKENNIDINTIGIITNGTVCSNKHIEVLKELKNSCDCFQFYLSSDLFHRIEWRKLSLTDRVNINYEKYKEELGIKKVLNDDYYKNIVLYNKGRAKLLTIERIEELYKKYHVTYKIREMDEKNNLSYIENNIYGKVCIDVHGNLIDFSISYDEENKSIKDDNYNVNCFPLNEIIYEYINNKKEKQLLKKV